MCTSWAPGYWYVICWFIMACTLMLKCVLKEKKMSLICHTGQETICWTADLEMVLLILAPLEHSAVLLCPTRWQGWHWVWEIMCTNRCFISSLSSACSQCHHWGCFSMQLKTCLPEYSGAHLDCLTCSIRQHFPKPNIIPVTMKDFGPWTWELQ